jgi:hypothetical protein
MLCTPCHALPAPPNRALPVAAWTCLRCCAKPHRATPGLTTPCLPDLARRCMTRTRCLPYQTPTLLSVSNRAMPALPRLTKRLRAYARPVSPALLLLSMPSITKPCPARVAAAHQSAPCAAGRFRTTASTTTPALPLHPTRASPNPAQPSSFRATPCLPCRTRPGRNTPCKARPGRAKPAVTCRPVPCRSVLRVPCIATPALPVPATPTNA